MLSKLFQWGEMTSGQTLPGKASFKTCEVHLWRRKIIGAKAPSDLHAMDSPLRGWLGCPVLVLPAQRRPHPALLRPIILLQKRRHAVKQSWCLLDSASFCQKDADVSGWHTQKNPFLVVLGWWWALDQSVSRTTEKLQPSGFSSAMGDELRLFHHGHQECM